MSFVVLRVVGRIKFYPFFPPVPTDYFADCLRVSDLDAYRRTEYIIAQAAEHVGGYLGKVYEMNTFDLIDKGLMRPKYVVHDDGMFEFYFEMWSLFEGCFKRHNEMSREDAQLINQMMVYPTRRN